MSVRQVHCNTVDMRAEVYLLNTTKSVNIALNKDGLTTEGTATGTYIHCGPRPLRCPG